MRGVDFRQLETHLERFFKLSQASKNARTLLLVRSAES